MTARGRQGGIGLVTAVFILVVLSGLAVAIANIGSMQQISSAMDERGVRAYQAARAGIEWGLYRSQIDKACTTTSTFTLPAPTLSGFSVTVTCDPTVVWTKSVRRRLTATACTEPAAGGICPNDNPSSPDYVQRRAQAEVQVDLP